MILRIRLHLADYWLWFLQRQSDAVERSIRAAHQKRARLLGQLPPEQCHG